MDDPQTNATELVNELLAKHAAIKQFRPLFENRIDCAEYFARANAEFNGLDRATGRCCVCKQDSGQFVANYQWEARFSSGFRFGPLEAFLLTLGHIGVHLKYTKLSFQTFHPICQTCKQALRKRRGLANVLNFVGLFLKITASLLAALGWAGALYFTRTDDKTSFLQIGAVATGLMLLGIICMVSLNKLRVPPSLRYFTKPPFTRHRIEYVPGPGK